MDAAICDNDNDNDNDNNNNDSKKSDRKYIYYTVNTILCGTIIYVTLNLTGVL